MHDYRDPDFHGEPVRFPWFELAFVGVILGLAYLGWVLR